MLAYMTPESTQFILLYLSSAVNKHIDWEAEKSEVYLKTLTKSFSIRHTLLRKHHLS